MIIDNLKNYKTYLSLNPRFEKAFNYLLKTNFSTLADGKHEIDGENLFALMQTYNTKAENEMRFEAHKKYIDIQFIISGSESFQHTETTSCKTIEDYNTEKDVAFFEAKGTTYQVNEKQYYILFPQDAHKPSLHYKETSQAVKKVVLKVLI